jgi:hypothetical protein
MIRRLHRKRSHDDSPLLLGILVGFAALIGGIVSLGEYGERHMVHAQAEPGCRAVYVRSMSGKFVNLYADSDLTVAIPNPFYAHGNDYEIHTGGVRDLKIHEEVCR